ncbi:MAG: hypothetical protein PF636_09580 [Actinomycetota bacterium]|nr:hypothetical protein [Actinomycetota bacterium]
MSPEVNAITDPISSALFYSVPILLTAAAILAVVANAPSRAKILRLLALVVAAGLTFWAGILLDLVPHGLVVSAAIVSFTPVFAADNPASRTRLIVASVVLLTVGLLIAPAANVDDLSSIGAVIILLFPVGLQCLMAVMGIEAILSGRA